MQPSKISDFQQTVLAYYDACGRHELPWRQPETDGRFDPYKIMVSELMLQQTQVGRVIPKYLAFIRAFPTIQTLAGAPLADVLTLWSGLGYNRRAKFLSQAAGIIGRDYSGRLPEDRQALVGLPGIGANTAGAILVYAFNRPEVFIETNVRTVYFHHFFGGQINIADKALRPIIEQTLPAGNARQWYWALMDYGTHLKQAVGNLSQASSHYAKQSAFAGSRRQIRGQILRLLTETPRSAQFLRKALPDERLDSVLTDLQQEGFIQESGSRYRLPA